MEYLCHGCHTEHIVEQGFDDCCPNCGEELPDGVIQAAHAYLDDLEGGA